MTTDGLEVASKEGTNIKACKGRELSSVPVPGHSLLGSPKPTGPGDSLKKVALRKFFKISRETSRVTCKFSHRDLKANAPEKGPFQMKIQVIFKKSHS